jgi:tetratricopeptide (TPR) repeat protein
LTHPIELVVVSVKHPTLRVRPVGSRQEITLRTRSAWQQVPGEIIAVQGKKFWRYSGHPYLSGEILSHRQDVTVLGLTPLKIEERGIWDPAEEYWGEEGDPSPDWAQAIIAHGRRPSCEMEQIIPGNDPEDLEDNITRSADLKESGALDEAEALLMTLLQADHRCLDAHVHLGNIEFDRRPEKAARHYRLAQGIGELSLVPGFRDVLLWGHINNRPYLRALHGLALSLWRLNQRPEAIAIFERMLWLNPPDNQGVRVLLPDIQAGMTWEASGALETSGSSR